VEVWVCLVQSNVCWFDNLDCCRTTSWRSDNREAWRCRDSTSSCIGGWYLPIVVWTSCSHRNWVGWQLEANTSVSVSHILRICWRTSLSNWIAVPTDHSCGDCWAGVHHIAREGRLDLKSDSLWKIRVLQTELRAGLRCAIVHLVTCSCAIRGQDNFIWLNRTIIHIWSRRSEGVDVEVGITNVSLSSCAWESTCIRIGDHAVIATDLKLVRSEVVCGRSNNDSCVESVALV